MSDQINDLSTSKLAERDRADAVRLAHDYLNLKRCAGGRLVVDGYMCARCGADPSMGACNWAKNTPGRRLIPNHPDKEERETMSIAALYVESGGIYAGLPGVELWDEAWDARLYAGPWPVVAHPPCQRWGRFWHGSTRKPHQFQLGDDGGCFAAALAAVRRWGGVLEHPAASHAWKAFGLTAPPRDGGWVRAESLWDDHGGWTCYVEQGFYGHASRKPTWLYAAGVVLPELSWGCGAQRIPAWMIDRYGYEKARRIGVVAMIGGKDKTKIRNATPEPFRDLLIGIARSFA